MIGTVAIALLVLYLLVGEPWFGRIGFQRMRAALAAGDAGARLRFFRQWIWQGWLLTLVVLGVTLGFAGWTPAQLGLRMPYWPHPLAVDGSTSSGFAAGLVIGVAIAGGAGLIVGIVSARRQRRAAKVRAAAPRTRGPVGNPQVLQMLPRTPAERRAFAALAVTAGVGEEIVWRGFGLTLLFTLLPGAHPAIAIALASAAFGCAHLYQGAVGIVVTAVLGAVFAILFRASGSLLWPMLLHVLIDLRVLLLRAPAQSTEGGSP